MLYNEADAKKIFGIYVLSNYSIKKMLELHLERYPYSHDRELILNSFTNFSTADDDFTPICLHGKHWEFIKDDFEEAILKFKGL